MQAGYRVLDQYRTENGRYILTASKSVPAFKAGNVGEENKWVTLYAWMAHYEKAGWTRDGRSDIVVITTRIKMNSFLPWRHINGTLIPESEI